MGYCTLNKKCNWNEKRQIYLIGCKVQFWNSQLIFRIIAINLRLLWLLLLLMSEAPPRPVRWMVVNLCRIRSWGSILLLRFLSAPRFLRLVDDEGDLCGTVCWYLKVYTQMHPLECFCAPALPELWFNWIATLNYKYKINNKNELLRGQATIYLHYYST